ncbi:hypothetical protein KAI30_02885 [Candidatus Bathyarchaeota archaeon]|nr:hypothetical protein [Candidatus Bathyarchaeota archaeon]
MDEITIQVEVEINPTEDPEKVKRAVENLLGNAEFEIKQQRQGSLLVAKAEGMDGLTKFYNLLRRERIRDATRRVLFGGLSGKSIAFYLNKQVAYVGHVSFSQPTAESPLGPIKVQIQCDNPRELIEWLAPKTA